MLEPTSFNPDNCIPPEVGCISCDTAHIKQVDQCYPTDVFLNKNMQFAQYARKYTCLAVSANKQPHVVSTPFDPKMQPTYNAAYKQGVLNHGPNYIGTSKKMQYAKYVKTTPGLETFANKKYAALQTAVAQKQQCFSTLCAKFE